MNQGLGWEGGLLVKTVETNEYEEQVWVLD